MSDSTAFLISENDPAFRTCDGILGPDQSGKFAVEIKDPVPRGVVLYFTATDGAQGTATVDYTSAP